MEQLAADVSVVVACGFATLGLPAAVAAHHPGGGGEGGPWFLLSLLVLALTFLAVWAISTVLERREKRSSQRLHRRRE
jgi:membrane protein implicated in regulation of membrane protease activity